MPRAVNFKQRLPYVTAIAVAFFVVVAFLWLQNDSKRDSKIVIDSQIIAPNIPLPLPFVEKCRMHTNECFNVYRCSYNERNKIDVYVYPFTNYFDEKGQQISPSFSKEFYELVMAIKESDYYTNDMNKACVIIPPIDLLNQRRINITHAGQILSSLPSWKKFGGKNHLIFNQIPGEHPHFNTILDIQTAEAILAGGSFSYSSYRPGFDVSIPVINSLTRFPVGEKNTKKSDKKWFLASTQVNFNADYLQKLENIADSNKDVLVLSRCLENDVISSRCHGGVSYNYPQILQSSTFCLVVRGLRLGQSTLLDVLMMGCIPVIVADGYVLPFSDVIDWSRASVVIREAKILDLYKILKTYTAIEIDEMKKQVNYLWNNYFNSMKAIALTTIKIINDRVFFSTARSYEDWNTPSIPSSAQASNIVHPPFIIPLMSPKVKGFTAVVLTYDRETMLFRVLEQVAKAPSLAKIVVVWNNVERQPPPVSEWPILTKPVKVIEMKANKLTNRFFPFEEIETEAIFSLDDDIAMLTADEIQFAFEVWSEYPDRLVGFPGRLHTSSNTSLKYESEWLNDVSIILTGAAFHHKYFSHVFTYMMPAGIRNWVDKHMNCEDIAMNFLIANYTGKAPIKVTPRKRFKCPECKNEDALGVNKAHFMERSRCIQEFADRFGKMPLKTAEFRADPILQQDDIPVKMKKFQNIGII